MARVMSHSSRFLQSPVLRVFTTGSRSRSTDVIASVSGCPFTGHAETSIAEAPTKIKADGVRPFEEIPSTKRLPFIDLSVGMIKSGGYKLHEYVDQQHKKLGPIFRDKLGQEQALIICDAQSIARTFELEGRYPDHIVPKAWEIYNEVTGFKRGLFFMKGEQWYNRRSQMNPVLFNTAAVTCHGPAFNDVIGDLLANWQQMTSAGQTIPDLEHELYNWSIECLGAMVFGHRLGCVRSLKDASPEMPQNFATTVQKIFHETTKMTLIQPDIAYKLNLPVWNRFAEAATTTLNTARTYVQKRMREIESLQAQGVKVDGLLSVLMADKTIQEKEIVEIVADLVIAAADTTSHAVQWALHMLATHPECQEKLLSEINEAVAPGELIEEHHLNSIPYAMKIIKETMRMYPIAPFITRIATRDIVLRNYEVPKTTKIVMSQYTVGRDPERFPEPNKFYPDRWIQTEDRHKRVANKGCVPFALGFRSCIGRRVAELQMKLLLTRTIQKFQLESANEEEVDIVIRMITTPSTPIKLRLKRRNP